MSRNLLNTTAKIKFAKTSNNARKLERLQREMSEQQEELAAQKQQVREMKKLLSQEKSELKEDQSALLVKTNTLKQQISKNKSLHERLQSKQEFGMKSSKKFANIALRRELDQTKLELKIVKRKLKVALETKTNKRDYQKMKALQKRWNNEKKLLKVSILELEERANYYKAQLNRFMANQDKWLKQQQKMNKSKKQNVHYVFIDDIKEVFLHPKINNRMRVRTKKGREMLLTNITINKTKFKKSKKNDPQWQKMDEIAAQVLKNLKKKGKGGSRKRSKSKARLRKKSSTAASGSDEDEEADEDYDEEEDEEDEEDFQVHRGDISDWLEELRNRNEDMTALISLAAAKQRQSRGGHAGSDTNMSLNLNFDSASMGSNTPVFTQPSLTGGSKLSVVDDNKESESKENGNGNGNENENESENESAVATFASFLVEINDRNSERFASIMEEMEEEENKQSESNNNSDVAAAVVHDVEESLRLLAVNCQSYEEKLRDMIMYFQQMAESAAEESPTPTPQTPMDERLQLHKLYFEEMQARSNDIKAVHSTVYSQYENSNGETLTEFENVLRDIRTRADNMDDLQLMGNIEVWQISVQEIMIRQALMSKELSDRRQEISEMITNLLMGTNASITNEEKNASMKLIFEHCRHRHQNVPQIIDVYQNKTIVDEEDVQDNDSDFEEDVDFEDLLPSSADNISAHAKDSSKKDQNKDLPTIFENMAGFAKDNELWRNLMSQCKQFLLDNAQNTPADADDDSELLEKSMKSALTEMNARTLDMNEIKNAMIKPSDEQTAIVLTEIENRHIKLNEKIAAMLVNNSEAKEEDEEENVLIVDAINNSDWWEAVQELLINKRIMDNQLMLKAPGMYRKDTLNTPEVDDDLRRKGSLRGMDFNENLKFLLSEEVDDMNSEFFEQETPEATIVDWWLMKNGPRNKVLQDIYVPNTQSQDLLELGIYVSRVLKFDTHPVVQLYIPIDIESPPSAQLRILASMFDGVLLARLIHVINEDVIDFRGIHKPVIHNETENSNHNTNTNTNVHRGPHPIKSQYVNQNIAVILSSAKAMGISLPQIFVQDWWDPNTHIQILISILKQLASHSMDTYCNINSHPELIRCALPTEESDVIRHIPGEDWIPRWINFVLKRDLSAHSLDFNHDFTKVLAGLDELFLQTLSANNPNVDTTELDRIIQAMTPSEVGQGLISAASEHFSIKTPIEIQDFVSNNHYCQDYFAAQIFDIRNGLQILSKTEDQAWQKKVAEHSTTDETFVTWINSFGLQNTIANIDSDITSGLILLHILEKIKRGCVNWKKAQKKVKNKFDKIVNCNYAITICTKKLGLKFVNVSGTDIVDKNVKIIQTVLWRIMRYQSTKILADLQFHGKEVTNEDIVNWCNSKLNESKINKYTNIRSLKDSYLTTGIYYLELLHMISPEAIDVKLISYKVPPLSRRDLNNDDFREQRKNNLKYAMTIIRRYGTDLFVSVTDLIRLEPRAILSILAAVMTIGLSKERVQTKYDSNHMKQNKGGKNGNSNGNSGRVNAKNGSTPIPVPTEDIDEDFDALLDSVLTAQTSM